VWRVACGGGGGGVGAHWPTTSHAPPPPPPPPQPALAFLGRGAWWRELSHQSRWRVGSSLAPAVTAVSSELVNGPGNRGGVERHIDTPYTQSTVQPREQRTRVLTRSCFTAYITGTHRQTRLPGSIAKGECSARSEERRESFRSRRQRKRPASKRQQRGIAPLDSRS
jgi:hypothetical protein